MECVEVFYRGPSRAYSAEHDGQWYEFARGLPLVVPESLAERLLDVPGHTFEIGDEVEASAPAPSEELASGSGSGEGSGSGDDPFRVNAAPPYGGGEA